MAYDFNSAQKHVPPSSLIPRNTIVPVHLTLRPGNAGEGGWLKRNRESTCLMLDCELTVIEGQYARRKVWAMLVVEGETEGQQKAADITGSMIRGMLEAARGINPSDESEAAMAGRRINNWGDLDGLRFQAVIGIRKQEGYEDKNTFSAVVTPDRKDYEKIAQVGGTSRGAPGPVAQAAQAASIAKASSTSRPSWAS